MHKVHNFVYGNINSKDNNIGVHGGGTFSAPERIVETFNVDGRNGDIVIDSGSFRNLNITYHCYIINKFGQNMDDFRSKLKSLTGYQILEDSFHPDEYREGVLIDAIEPSVYGKARTGEFDLVFNCKPQRWLKSGQKSLSMAGGIIKNPTYHIAKPIIRAYGRGTLKVNGVECVINNNPSWIDIDSEYEDCYRDNVNCNKDVLIPTFPELMPGNNEIVLKGIEKVEITPKWYTI